MNKLLKLYDFFIPDHLRTNPNDLTRAYILIGVIFTNIFTSLVILIALLTFFSLPEENQKLALAFDVYCLLGYGLTLFLFYKTENYTLASNCIVLLMYSVVFPAILVTGGYIESPVTQLILLVPVTGFLLTGMRSGLKWLILSTVSALAIFIAAKQNFMVYQLIINPADAEYMGISLQFVLLFMLGISLVIYEMINESLKSRLNEERDKFEHRASHDSLTSIPNRFEFFRRLNQNIIECDYRQQKLGIAYIDLDGFKPVNDEYGHQAGDLLLQVIAKRLKTVLRLSDTVARLGGDEFALILPGIHVPDDINIIMQKALVAIRQPIDVGNGEMVRVHGSTGVAIYPDHSRDMNDLCRFADIAMYKAKEDHNTFLIYNPSMKKGRS